MTSTSRQSDAPRDVALGFFENVAAGRYEAALQLLAPDVAFEIIAPPPYGRTVDRDGLLACQAAIMAPAFAGPVARRHDRRASR